jgi:glycine betaine/proline transport system substrate-binding protein
LLNYADVFVDDENPNMGRVYGAIPGWAVDEILFRKYEYLGLDEKVCLFQTGIGCRIIRRIDSRL